MEPDLTLWMGVSCPIEEMDDPTYNYPRRRLMQGQWMRTEEARLRLEWEEVLIPGFGARVICCEDTWIIPVRLRHKQSMATWKQMRSEMETSRTRPALWVCQLGSHSGLHIWKGTVIGLIPCCHYLEIISIFLYKESHIFILFCIPNYVTTAAVK